MRRTPQWLLVALLAAGFSFTVACQKTFRGSVAQPNPLTEPNETSRISESITIETGDMELLMPKSDGPGTGGTMWVDRRYPLRNIASFTVVSRDRLRFHVQIEHKWMEWAKISGWKIYLLDDQGHRYEPEQIMASKPRHLVSMWDYETRSAIRNHFRDIVAVLDDGYRRRKPLASLSVFRGRADLVFYARDIFTPDIKSLTLVLERPTMEFRWSWRFADAGAPGEPPLNTGDIRHMDELLAPTIGM
jgi:hypothetical protein